MENLKKNIMVFSQEDFEKYLMENNIDNENVSNFSEEKAFIQIIGTKECLKYYLDDDTDFYFNNTNSVNVLNLAFDDINGPNVEWEGHTFYGITKPQIIRVVNFIEKHKGKDFYISCRAGKSRSQAICRYILDVYGKEYGYVEKESCRKDNPCLTPNIYVLTKLKREYRDYMERMEQDATTDTM